MISMFKTTMRSVSAVALAQALVFGAVPALADEAADDSASEAPVITVTGRRVSEAAEAIGEGSVTNTVAVTRDALLSAPSGVSGLKMLEQLPGFNVQTDGALGLYEFGNSVQTRAFNLDQIGFVVDGIPTGRSDAFGGSPVFRYVDNENLAAVVASPGAGDVSMPSYSSLGAMVEYRSIEPQDDLGLFVSQSFGDFDMKRTFIRFSTGQVGPFKAYVSRTKLDTDLWRGAGSVDREHWEGQIKADLGGGSWARFKFVSNNFYDIDSPTLARAQYQCLYGLTDADGVCGRYFGYTGTLYDYPETVPGVQYSNSAYTNYYGLAINHRNDKLYGLTLHGEISNSVWAEATGYWEQKAGYGVSPDSYSNSYGRYLPESQAGLDVVAPKGVQYGVSGVGGDRYGITMKVHADIGAHAIEAGIWAEEDKYHRTQKRTNTLDGSPASAPALDEIVYLRRDYHSKRETTQLFIKDRISLFDDKLNLDLGIKSLFVDYRQSGYRDYADYYLTVGGVGVPGWGPQTNTASYKDGFLPSVGLLYHVSDRAEIFASYSENYALPKGMDDIYSVAFTSSAALVPQPDPEKAKNFELGIRTRQPEFFASLAAFYTKFDNRIQSITSILPGSAGATESFYTNVGGVEAYGAEFSGSYKPAFLNGLAYANLNVTYNNATFKDDLVTATTTYAISGNNIPDNAKWLVSGGVTIEPASWLVANVSGKYTGKRYADFTNKYPVKGYTVFSGYVDIGDGWSLGPLKTVKARINVDNIFDKDTLGYIYPQVASDGYFRPLSPRTFQFTISAEY
ncbi:TonB-dependent receptor [Novosphingobium album (ex Hu et al. 2023)]|uniref:TonB-dependent receptor n=1 Tax=Novosphingobium album (ex Hu et al. 2023) TaxID=2930093 RepID=A0ABT0B4K3_9SPHN|nr:TonB-dependent receptor [Novosphingobium album (ex Hu et al. 2023)]MCJ2179814.1 TonB-dependent receptor [Novosphingobium album (ex Hu et al. 2023)]